MASIDRFLTSPVRAPVSFSARGSSPADGMDGSGTLTSSAVTSIDPSLMSMARKRPAEDMTQYAEAVSRNVRLKADAKEELLRFAQASGQEQGIWLAARLLAHEERLDAIQPAESVYHIPGKLQGKLDKTSFLVLVDHSIPAYLTKKLPLKRVQAYLEKFPSFGWTAEVKADKSKTKVLLTRIRTKLTHTRNNIKNLLEKSIGTVDNDGVRHDYTDIYTLADQIMALGSRVASDTKLSLDFCVRVALLRAKIQEYPGQDYWTKVDDYLEQVRVKKNNDPDRIAEVFGAIYDQDILMFDVKLDHKELAALTEVRPEVFDDQD